MALDRYETLCPTTGLVCPVLAEYQTLFVGNQDNPEVDGALKADDRALFTRQRAAHLIDANSDHCAGPQGDSCPIHERSLAKGFLRTTVVSL